MLPNFRDKKRVFLNEILPRCVSILADPCGLCPFYNFTVHEVK